jgi:hypothetical protein
MVRVASGGVVRGVGGIAVWTTGSLMLAGCVSPNLIHDPQTGIISREQVPGFLKSVRCELATFYEANWYNIAQFQKHIGRAESLSADAARNTARRSELLREAERERGAAVAGSPNFPVSSKLFGGVYLELKVVDTLGVGAGDTNLVNKQLRDASHTQTWGVSPSLNSQNTYDMNFSFIVDQSKGLSRGRSADPFQCYDPQKRESMTPVMLAEGHDNGAAQFTRIVVNGSEPLAAWLMDNSKETWINFRAKQDSAEREQLIPVQMNYAFSVQVTAGVNVKYSLTAPVWSPEQIGGGVSSVQTSQMSIFINGDDANLAGGAKLGTAVNDNAGKPPFVEVGRIGRGPREKELASIRKQIDVTRKSLDQLGATILKEGPTDATSKLRADLTAQLEQLRRRQNALTATVSAPLTIERGGQGNVRGHLNAPIGIVPP